MARRSCRSIENRCARLVCHFAEPSDDAHCDRAGLSVSDSAPISLNYWNDLGSGSREEAFVGYEDVVPREICLDHFEVELAGNIKHDRSRDSLQRSSRNRGREDLAVL